jgi:hypothetical protein
MKMATIIITLIGLSIVAVLLIRHMKQPITAKERAPIMCNRVQIDCTTHNMAVKHLMEHEGFAAFPYEQNGNRYIGYGHQLNASRSFLNNGITLEHAKELLKRDLEHCVLVANREFDIFGNRALAVGMLIFNTGLSGMKWWKPDGVTREMTTLCRLLIIQKDRVLTEKEQIDLRNSWLSFDKFRGQPHRKLRERREFEVKIYEL